MGRFEWHYVKEGKIWGRMVVVRSLAKFKNIFRIFQTQKMPGRGTRASEILVENSIAKIPKIQK